MKDKQEAVRGRKETGTRKKILEAALSMFSKRGFLGSATKDIAAEAGVAEVTLFRYFPSKEILFGEVIKTYSFLPRLKGLLSEIDGLPYEDALLAIARRFLDTCAERKDMIKIMHSEVQHYPAQTRQIHHAVIEQMFTALAGWFEGLQEKGVLRRFDPGAGARAFLGMFFQFFTAQELKLRKRLTPEENTRAIEEYVRIFARGTII